MNEFMRITRNFLRSLPVGHKKTYTDVEPKSFENATTICTTLSRIERNKDYIITRDWDKWELTIEVQPYGYRKRLQAASKTQQGVDEGSTGTERDGDGQDAR